MKKFRFQSIIGIMFIYLFLANVTLVVISIITINIWFSVVAIFLSLFQLFLHNTFKSSHLLWRGFHFNQALKTLNPKVFKVLVKSSINSKVSNYGQLKLINDRASNKPTSLAIGSFYNPGYMEYERIRCRNQSVRIGEKDLKVTIGTSQCAKPYVSNILNIGAISHETISKTAIFALSEGAKIGGFSINTGENGISPYHIRGAGDLIWQIGPNYSGCRSTHGAFNEHLFKKNATRNYVKMIEINLCVDKKLYEQAALTRIKHTPGLKTNNSDRSLVLHTAFTNESEMMSFISRLRLLSGGKPIGTKVCISDKAEFENLCIAMSETGIYLDFITIEGAREGNYLQMSLLDALAFSSRMLRKYELPSKIIASGSIITEYDIIRAMALGADACYSTRGMLLSLRENSFVKPNYRKFNKLLTIFKRRLNGDFELEDNRVRVASFHKNTMDAVIKLMKLCAYESLADVKARDFYRRTDTLRTITLEDIYFNDEMKNNNRPYLLTSLN